jgi:hypothetical protein
LNAGKTMKELPNILKEKKYKKIKFHLTRTNHLLVRAMVNGVRGRFILDTGASNSCVGFDHVGFFRLTTADSKTRAAGAGAIGMLTQVANRNILKIGRWRNGDFSLVVFDLSHVNAALTEHKVAAVQGIIGADVLLQGEAVIDYANRLLYLK